MLIYIHVPFCHSKCNYCAFTSWKPEPGETAVYLENLLDEIALWGERLGRVPVHTVFIGGGTPSLLPPAAIGALLDKLDKTFITFPEMEISMEANPQSGRSAQYYSDLLRAGVNRLSLGVQSLNDSTLRMMGRPHNSSDAIKAMHDAREAGFSNINLDFMWGLPGQRVRQWKEDLKYVAQHLKPEHLSCYGLTIEEHTPFYELNLKKELKIANERELGHMFMDGAEILEECGYMQYEISNFSKLGFQCKHNLGYWAGRDYLGLGPGAVSTIQAKRWTNPYDFQTYVTQITKKMPPANLEELDLRTKVLELIMLNLRTNKGLDAVAYRKLTGNDFFAENRGLINALHAKQLIRIRNKHLMLTRSGMLVSNTILSHMFESVPQLAGATTKELEGNAMQAGQLAERAQAGQRVQALQAGNSQALQAGKLAKPISPRKVAVTPKNAVSRNKQ